MERASCASSRQKAPKVLIADLNLALAEEVAAEVGGFAAKADVASNESVVKLAEIAASKLGGVDILVNNAGITHLPKLMQEVEFDFVRLLNPRWQPS